MTTPAELLAHARARLAAAGLDQPAREARALLAEATGWSQAALLGADTEPLPPEADAAFRDMLGQLERRVPLARILGWAAFRGLSFALDPATLVPRPESETVVDAALARLPDAPAEPRVLDLGTGSGCLLLALAHDAPHALGLGTDAEPRAAATAARNARALGLAHRVAAAAMPWAAAVASASIDLVLANPPYVRRGDLPELAPEVARHDPALALDGGPDGLDAYRALWPEVARVLRPGGRAVVEVGAGQADEVAALARGAGLIPDAPVADLGGRWRCVPVKKDLA